MLNENGFITVVTNTVYQFQLQSEWAQVAVIELRNDGAGFGFGISGSRNSGAVVRNIFPGGAADRVSEQWRWKQTSSKMIFLQ